EIFDAATMELIRVKSERLTGYLEFLLDRLPGNFCTVITPRDPRQRGCQLSIRVKGDPRAVLASLKESGAVCDFREPDIIRAAPAPLYNSYMDVYSFARILSRHAR
ncbi:MAG TPA: hypothetical protein V6D08_05325, partial [Candidatus Obscuribacterales bacterium]